jgi:cell division inhibitor SulA
MKQLSIYETDYLDGLHHLAEAEKPPFSICRADDEAFVNQTLIDHRKTEASRANVTEIILTKDKADCIQMLLPMLTHLNQEKRWLAWIDPPIQLLKQWRQTHETLATEDIMILRSNDSHSAYELTEKALNAGTCHAVIVWTNKLSNNEFEQLEDASSKGNSHGIILRYR